MTDFTLWCPLEAMDFLQKPVGEQKTAVHVQRHSISFIRTRCDKTALGVFADGFG